MHPLFTIRELVMGNLHWNPQYRESTASEMVRMLNPASTGLHPSSSIADYEVMMQPIYSELQKAAQGMQKISGNVISAICTEGNMTWVLGENESSTTVMRSTRPANIQQDEKYTWLWQTIISRESTRFLYFVTQWEERTTDEDERYYEYTIIQEALDDLIDGLVQCDTDEIQQFLRYELSTLWEEIELRKQSVSMRVQESQQAHRFTSRAQVFKSSDWWNHRVQELLNNWIPKYYNTAPLGELCAILDNMMEQSVRMEQSKTPHNDLTHSNRHLQIILLMIIIKKVHTGTQRDQILDTEHADNLLRLTDKFLHTGGDTLEEAGSIIEYANLLDQADAEHKISRFPILFERMEKMNTIIQTAFSRPPAPAEEIAAHLKLFAEGKMPTAAERLRYNFFTLEELSEVTGQSTDALRKHLKDVNTVKRGVTFISYSSYTKKNN